MIDRSRMNPVSTKRASTSLISLPEPPATAAVNSFHYRVILESDENKTAKDKAKPKEDRADKEESAKRPLTALFCSLKIATLHKSIRCMPRYSACLLPFVDSNTHQRVALVHVRLPVSYKTSDESHSTINFVCILSYEKPRFRIKICDMNQ